MIAPIRAEAHSRNNHPLADRLILLEGLVLLLAAPFLVIPEFSPGITLTALLALGAVWTISHLSARQPASPFDVIFALWCVALMIGMLVTADPQETLPKATNLVLGLGVWRFLLIAVRTRRTLAIAVACFLLLGVGFSLVGIAGSEEFPKIPALMALNPFRGRLPAGLGGLAIHPNQLAGLMCLYWPLLIALSFAPPSGLRSRPWRVVIAAVALLATLILILTQSRGGWLAAAAGLFALTVLWGLSLPPSGTRRAMRLAAVGWVLAGLLALAWIGPDRLQETWLNPPKETAVGTLLTLNYRKALWPWAITAVQDFPFTGVGLGAFRQVAFRLYPLALSPGQDIGHAHNIFLQTALDVGLPGLIVYAALLFVAAAVGWRVARCETAYRAIALGLLAGLIAVHVFGLADALALGSKPGVVFWYSLGLLAAMNRMVSRPHRRQ